MRLFLLLGLIKQKSIILMINFFGLFGFDILSFSERFTNKQMNSYFSKLVNKNEDLLHFIKDRDHIDKIISKRFSNKLNSKLIDFITEVIMTREMEVNLTHHNIGISTLSDFIDEKRMKIQDYFLLAKLLSKLGQFQISHEIEKKARYFLLSSEFYSVYSLFQIVKCKLQDEVLMLHSYLTKNRLINHFNKFYKINRYLDTVNSLNKDDVVYVMGPLRTLSDYYSFKGKNIAVINPNSEEVELILSNRYLNCYLYTFKPIEFKINDYLNVHNVHFLKSKGSIDNVLFRDIYNTFLILNGYPMGLQRVLLHQVLQLKKRYFYLDFFNFYLSKDFYSDNYRHGRGDLGKMISKYKIKELIWGSGWHDLIANFKFVKSLQKQGMISSSELTGEVLDLTPEEYALALERLFSF